MRDEETPFPLRFVHVEGVTWSFLVGNEGDPDLENGRELLTGGPADFLRNMNQLFRGGGTETPITRVPGKADFLDLLVLSQFFPSRGQAKKNWRGPQEISDGYSEHVVGKGRHRKIFFVYKAWVYVNPELHPTPNEQKIAP